MALRISYKQRSALWLFISLMSLFFFYSVELVRPAMYSKLIAIQGLLVLFAISSLFIRNSKVYYLQRKWVIFLYLLFVVSLVPSCLGAINQGKAWVELSKLISFFLLFVVAYITFNQFDLKKVFTRSIVVFIILSLLIAAVQFVAVSFDVLPEPWLIKLQEWFGAIPQSKDMHQMSYFIKSVFAHRNIFAQIVLLCFPFLVYAVITEKRTWRYLALIVVMLSVIPMVFLFVRTVWIGLIGMIFMAVLIMLIKGVTHRNLKLVWIPLVTLIVIFSVRYMVIKKSSLQTTFLKQTDGFKNTSYGSVNERILIWKATLPMIADHPIKGVGPGNWSLAIPKYQNNELRNTSKGYFTQFQRAHNDYLQLISEYGILPFLIYLAFVLIAFGFVIKRIWKSNREDQIWSVVLFLSMVAYAGISVFSFPNERVEHQTLFTFILAFAYLSPAENTISTPRIRFPKILCVSIAIVGLLLSFFTWNLIQSDKNLKSAYTARAVGDKAQYEFFKEAKNTFYQVDPNGTPLAWYEAYQYLSSGNVFMAKDLLNESLKAHPYHKHSMNDLGSVFYSLKNIPKAKRLYQRTLDISPEFTDANVNMAIIELQNSKLDSAWYYLSQCDTLNYHKSYRPALLETCRLIIPQLIASIAVDDSILVPVFQRMMAEEKWLWQIHKHAVENKRNFRNQCLEEALYALEYIDYKIDTEKALFLRRKYNY